MIVFDLDGTLALDHHRKEHLLKEPKDWDTYFSLCGKDAPAAMIIRIAEGLKSTGNRLALWSGRSMAVWPETYDWLERHYIHGYFSDIRMREINDHTQDDVLKRSWLRNWNSNWPDDPVTLVFEDRKRVVDMWRSEGIVCCQVAPGDF
jgi:hypothetical protein